MSANKLSYEKFTEELQNNYEKHTIDQRVTKSLRKVYETIRNCLVTFSWVHFTKFCKLGPWFLLETVDRKKTVEVVRWRTSESARMEFLT